MKCPICRGVFNKSEDLFSISDRPMDLIICSVCNRYFSCTFPCAAVRILWHTGEAYLLGLLAKIKCSICSYQLNL